MFILNICHNLEKYHLHLYRSDRCPGLTSTLISNYFAHPSNLYTRAKLLMSFELQPLFSCLVFSELQQTLHQLTSMLSTQQSQSAQPRRTCWHCIKPPVGGDVEWLEAQWQC